MLSPKKLETKKKNVCNACCYLWYNRERDWNSSSNASQIICVRTEFAIASAQITSFCLSDVAPLQLLSSRWFCVCVRGALFKYSALVITLFFFFIIIFSSYFFYIISSRSISLLLAASGLSLWYILVVMAGRCCCRCCTSMAHTLRFILISQFFLFFYEVESRFWNLLSYYIYLCFACCSPICKNQNAQQNAWFFFFFICAKS